MLVWQRVLDGLERHAKVAMVTVAATKGSVPREAGARLLVHPDGTFTGTIGGGTLEWRAIAAAQAALAGTAKIKAETRRFALGPELGQCCGGRVDLIVETFDAADRETVAGFAAKEAAGPFATTGRVAESGVHRQLADVAADPGSAHYDAGGVLVEGFGETRREVYLFGAGHVGRALVLALAPLPFSVSWIDSRADAFPAHVPANVTLQQRDDPAAALSAAPAGSFVLVMTHSHQLDLALVNAALASDWFPYVGLIGSMTKRARFEKRLAEAGVPRERVDALVCPIGHGGLKSKVPAVIAAATVTELLVRDEVLRSGSKEETPYAQRVSRVR